MRRAKYMRVMNEALKIAHLKRPNISIKLNEMWIDAFVVYFRFMGVWSIFLQSYFWLEAVKRRKDDKACNLVTANREFFHFKLDLTQSYWKPLLTGDGCWSMREKTATATGSFWTNCWIWKLGSNQLWKEFGSQIFVSASIRTMFLRIGLDLWSL